MLLSFTELLIRDVLCLSVSIGNYIVLVKLNLIMSNLAVTCIYIYSMYSFETTKESSKCRNQ